MALVDIDTIEDIRYAEYLLNDKGSIHNTR